MQKVIVEPVDGGWTVNVEDIDNPMMFASGRAAEDAARELALKLAKGGIDVELELRLRGGERAARFVVLAPVEHEDRPLMLNTGRQAAMA
ncbi:hypothetical protein [Brevundimonas sp. M20]|uniref:hypothetical protein n=1 Tax=Brevundimonas sp. M20 TaxID=2591463 RepID=UPI00197ADEAB|nr:hypothetical protein [Brevundimonas sp. M20]